MRDFIGAGLSDTKPNKNVINIIRVLVEDKDSTVYIPYSYVKDRPGKGKDPRVHFPPKDAGRPMTVVDIVGHQERFNFSVQCLVDVKVEYEDNGMITLADRRVWRNYHIIRDGELVVDHVVATLSKSAYEDLKEAGGILYLGDKELTNGFAYDSSVVYTVRFNGIPLVSSNWARPNALSLHSMLKDEAEVSEELKQAKKILKESEEVEPDENDSFSDIYKEAVEDYGESAGKEVNCVVYTVLTNPGYKSPKYTPLYEGAIKKDVKDMKIRQKDLRFRCACIKWAMESAASNRRSPYNWSDLYQKKAGSSRYYQETLVEIDDVKHRLERCEFKKTV